MPDVVIWMISGTKRIASFRIPASEVLYSPQAESCGQYCGKVFNMFMKVTTGAHFVSVKSLEGDLTAVIVCNGNLLGYAVLRKVLKYNFPSTVLFIAASQCLQQQLSNWKRHNLPAASMEWNKHEGTKITRYYEVLLSRVGSQV